MAGLEYDTRYLKAACEILEDYLLSKDIYRPIGVGAARGEPPYPQLTLGNLLLARRRAQARAQTPAQETHLRPLEAQIEAIQSRWRVAWENKARAEFRARLRLWGNYLDDYRRDPGLHVGRYSYEVGRRVLLQLLAVEAHELPDDQISLLGGLDKLVRAFFVAGEFVWDEELASSFPQERFWYLYGHLPPELVQAI